MRRVNHGIGHGGAARTHPETLNRPLLLLEKAEKWYDRREDDEPPEREKRNEKERNLYVIIEQQTTHHLNWTEYSEMLEQTTEQAEPHQANFQGPH